MFGGGLENRLADDFQGSNLREEIGHDELITGSRDNCAPVHGLGVAFNTLQALTAWSE